MGKILLVLFAIIPIVASAQKKKRDKDWDKVYAAPAKDSKADKEEPFKGATTIIANYGMAGDTLFKYIQQQAVLFGYTIDKRDNEFFVFTTELKPIKSLSYKIRFHVVDNIIRVTAEWISSVGLQIGYIKTEPKAQVLKYTSKIYETRNAFDEIISFTQTTIPISITYSK